MKRLIIEQSTTENYTSHSGLALIGLCLNRYSKLQKTLKAGIPLRHGIDHGDIIKSYIGTLCLGKSDFEAIENFRQDDYFKQSLSIKQVPSCSRLRQRLDEQADVLLPLIQHSMIEFLINAQVPVTQWHSLKQQPHSVKRPHECDSMKNHFTHFKSSLGRRFTPPPFVHRFFRFSNIGPTWPELLMIS